MNNNDSEKMLILCTIKDDKVIDFSINEAFAKHFEMPKINPFSTKYLRAKDKETILACAFYRGRVNFIQAVNHKHYFIETFCSINEDHSTITVKDITSKIAKRKKANQDYAFSWQK